MPAGPCCEIEKRSTDKLSLWTEHVEEKPFSDCWICSKFLSIHQKLNFFTLSFPKKLSFQHRPVHRKYKWLRSLLRCVGLFNFLANHLKMDAASNIHFVSSKFCQILRHRDWTCGWIFDRTLECAFLWVGSEILQSSLFMLRKIKWCYSWQMWRDECDVTNVTWQTWRFSYKNTLYLSKHLLNRLKQKTRRKSVDILETPTCVYGYERYHSPQLLLWNTVRTDNKLWHYSQWRRKKWPRAALCWLKINFWKEFKSSGFPLLFLNKFFKVLKVLTLFNFCV